MTAQEDAPPRIAYRLDDRIAWITIDDPASMNGLSVAMMEALLAAFDRADGQARAVVLTGAGRGFCSGMNLRAIPVDPASPDYDAGTLLESHVNPLIRRMRALPALIVGAVRGTAAGAGCSLALACDLIVAGESSFFLQAFRHVGLIPDGGSAFFITRAAGRARAAEMMLLGERLSAAQALEWGLVNRVVADDEVDAVAGRLAETLAAGPSLAQTLIKRLAWESTEGDLDDSLERERAYQQRAGADPDHREGLAAFAEKRAPRFGAA